MHKSITATFEVLRTNSDTVGSSTTSTGLLSWRVSLQPSFLSSSWSPPRPHHGRFCSHGVCITHGKGPQGRRTQTLGRHAGSRRSSPKLQHVDPHTTKIAVQPMTATGRERAGTSLARKSMHMGNRNVYSIADGRPCDTQVFVLSLQRVVRDLVL